MPCYFLDTSALVKHYHAELGSSKVDAILVEVGSEYWISRLTLAEGTSVFAKKVRTGEIAEVDFDRLRLRFFDDVRNRIVTPVRTLNAHFRAACDLIAKHGKTRQIHTLDAIQLAVALSIRHRNRGEEAHGFSRGRNRRPPLDKRDRNLIHLYLSGIGTGLGIEDAGFGG